MKKQILAAALLAVSSFGAYAAEGTTDIAPKFTYVDAGWVRNSMEIDTASPNIDFDGAGVHGSFEFAGQFHAFGGYEKTSNDEDFVDIDLTETQVGFGWHPKIADGANFVVEASWLNRKAEASAFGFSGEADEDLYRVSAGIRAAFNKVLVGNIKANYTDGQDSKSEFTPTVGLEVRFNPTWSLLGETEIASGLEKYTVGVRASF